MCALFRLFKPTKPAEKSKKTAVESQSVKSDKLPRLNPDEDRKLKRLQRDGIIILIDHPNLETGVRKCMEKKEKDKNLSWVLSYGCLIDIIAHKGDPNGERRKVLATHLVTSKRFQKKYEGQVPSLNYQKRHNIEVVESPDKRIHTRKEKGLDCTLTRIMTQEFEGIEILRLKGKKPPKRTFCLVAGDFDYIDVVEQARKSNCDVEIWFWTRRTEMSNEWKRKIYAESSLRGETPGGFETNDLGPFLCNKLTRWKKRKSSS